MKLFVIAVCLIGLVAAFPWGDKRGGGQGNKSKSNPMERLEAICQTSTFASDSVSLVIEGEFDLHTAITEICDYIRTQNEENGDDEVEEEVESTTVVTTTEGTFRELLARGGMFRKPKNEGTNGCQDENNDMDGGDGENGDMGTTEATLSLERLLEHIKRGGRNGSGEKKGKKRPSLIDVLISVCNDIESADEEDEEGTRAITNEDEFNAAIQLICDAVVER